MLVPIATDPHEIRKPDVTGRVESKKLNSDRPPPRSTRTNGDGFSGIFPKRLVSRLFRATYHAFRNYWGSFGIFDRGTGTVALFHLKSHNVPQNWSRAALGLFRGPVPSPSLPPATMANSVDLYVLGFSVLLLCVLKTYFQARVVWRQFM